jgi:anti-sigma factor RsiW
MTAPAQPNPRTFPRELLAAYADGELDDRTRAEVEKWLAAHPEARAEVEAQREFSPANVSLWERVEPAEPASSVWAGMRREIEEQLNPAAPARPTRSPRRVGLWAVGGLLTAGVAAAVAWVAFTTPSAPQGNTLGTVGVPKRASATPPELALAPSPRELPAAPVAGFAVLPMAGDDDVVLARVPDTRTGWLPVGRHPLAGFLVLATVEEVHLEEVDPSPAWPTGGPRMTTAPGDAPMIFAAKPR